MKMIENHVFSSKKLKAEACGLGFFACGIAKAGPVDEQTAAHYRHWIANGGHADMHYLANYLDKRLDPTLLLENAKSIIVVALNYAPAHRIPDGEYQLAVYAYGRDYHDIMKAKLSSLEHKIKSVELATAPQTPSIENTDAVANSKLSCDTVPILERYWAHQAGLGFIGRNHQLIIPQAGSMFFLGEIITTAEFDHYDSPMMNRCGICHQCIEACPTGALGNTFDSRKCLSYQTIENRGPIDDSVKDKLGTTIYGCDRCQQACPWNRFAKPTDIPELQPTEALLAMKRKDWQQLSVEDYQKLFKGSAVKRAKYEGLMRNIRAAENK